MPPGLSPGEGQIRLMAREPAKTVELDVQLATDEAPVPEGADFRRWIDAALAAAAPGSCGEMTVRLVGTDEGRGLNQDYRHKPGATDVLAFPGPATPGLPSGLPAGLGDLVVCLPVVHREAGEQGKDVLAHLAHLVVHGTLHLVGYTHGRASDAHRMEALEARILGDLGFPDPYAAEREPGNA